MGLAAVYSVIIPCISIAHARNTVASCRKILKPPLKAPQFIIVVDDSGEDKTEISDDIVFRYLKGVNGSYAARNEGARLATFDQFLFLDSDVEVLQLPSLNFAQTEDYLVGPEVSFDRAPDDAAERWYSKNAFKQTEFVKRFHFLPTIALFVPRHVFSVLNGFDESFVSGGDMDFGHRARDSGFKLAVDARFKVRTRLRTESQIVKKIERQSYGQVFELIKRGEYWRSVVLLRIVKNSALWLQSLLLGMRHPRDFSATRIYACRCMTLTASLFLSTNELIKRATAANISEISNERNT